MVYNVYQNDKLIAEGIEDKEYTVENLEPNTEYSFSVTGVIGDKESEKATITVKTKPIDVTGVTLSPKTSSAESGTAGTRQLTATVTPSNATNKSVSYAIAPSAAGLSVNNSGLISWSADTPAGQYTTTVTTADGTHTDTHVLTLKEPEPEEPEPSTEDEIDPESIEIDPKEHTYIDIWEPGTNKRFNVTILPEDAEQEYTVESSDESVIRASRQGMQAVATAMAPGTATLTVKTENGLTDSATITVPEQA